MIDAFNDRYKVNLILTVLFILGIGASLFFIYSLPSGLRLAEGYQPEFTKVYSVLGLTFLLGLFALNQALRYKKEVIVFRDRVIDTQTEGEAGEQAGKTTISLESLSSAFAEAQNENEVLQYSIQAICKQLQAGQGAVYLTKEENQKRRLELKAGYALSFGESTVVSYEYGEGLIGQVAATGNTLFVDEVPEGYITVISGLGSASPKFLLIVPMKNQQYITGAIEIASFTRLTDDQRKFVEESAQLIAEKISANS